MWRHKLSRLPEGFRKLTKITHLHLSDQLSEVPEQLSQLSLLRNLWLGVNRITTLPSWMGDLTSLEYFSLNGNPVTSLPPELARLTKLDSLDIRNTPLKPPFPGIIGENVRIVTN